MIAVVVLLVLLGISLLYAVRAQAPAPETVSYGRVLTELQEGQLRSVMIEGDRATVTLADGRTQQASTGGDGQLTRYDTLSRLADLRDRNAITEDEFQREKQRLLR